MLRGNRLKKLNEKIPEGEFISLRLEFVRKYRLCRVYSCMAIYYNMLPLKKTLLLIAAAALITQTLADWEHDSLPNKFNKRSLLYVRSSGSSSRSRSSLPWTYLSRNEPTDSLESQDSSAQASSEPQPIVQVNSVESAEEDVSSSASSEVQASPQPVKIVPVILPSGGSTKGESGRIVVKKVPVRKHQEVDSEEEDELAQDDREFGPAQNDLISFSYYPIKQQYDSSGAVVYEIQDTDLRTARSKGKKKKGCKKGKKGKKGRSKKGKKKKGKKGCSVKGGWWYVWDKKHGYISGRWGTPPPKGLEREHYWHNYGKHGHGYGQGYDGHGHMGWKKQQGWGWGGQGGGGGGGGGFGGFGGGGYGGHGHHHGHHGHGGGHHGGWGVPHQHYGWGWAEKVKKGWGWRR